MIPLSGQNTISLVNIPSRKEKISRFNHPDLIVVPIKINRGIVFMEAELGGLRGNFILDTGAPLMVINRKPQKNKKQGAHSFSASFVIEKMDVSDFQLAGNTWKNQQVLALDISHLEKYSDGPLLGMIGYSILKDFEVLLDYNLEQMVLINPKKDNLAHRTASPLASIPFELQDHLPVVEMTIDRKKLKLGLDTGAGANLIDDDYLPLLKELGMKNLPKEEIQGIDHQIQLVEAFFINQFELNGTPVDPMKYLVTDLSPLSKTTNLNLDGLLGAPFFEDLKFSLNYQTKMLHIWAIPQSL